MLKYIFLWTFILSRHNWSKLKNTIMTRGFVINNLKYHHIKKLLYVFIQEAEAEKQRVQISTWLLQVFQWLGYSTWRLGSWHPIQVFHVGGTVPTTWPITCCLLESASTGSWSWELTGNHSQVLWCETWMSDHLPLIFITFKKFKSVRVL